ASTSTNQTSTSSGPTRTALRTWAAMAGLVPRPNPRRVRYSGRIASRSSQWIGSNRSASGWLPGRAGSDTAAASAGPMATAPAAERLVPLPQRDQPLHPPQQRTRVVLLGLDVDRLVVVLRVDDDRQVQLLRVGPAEPGVAVAAPLHRGADAVAVAEVDVVAHA